MKKVLGVIGGLALLAFAVVALFFALSVAVSLLFFALKITVLVAAIYLVVKGTKKVLSKV